MGGGRGAVKQRGCVYKSRFVPGITFPFGHFPGLKKSSALLFFFSFFFFPFGFRNSVSTQKRDIAACGNRNRNRYCDLKCEEQGKKGVLGKGWEGIEMWICGMDAKNDMGRKGKVGQRRN